MATPPVRKARKPPTVTPALSAARGQSAAWLKTAWANAKASGKKRPDAGDIAAARTSMGLPAKGTSTH